MKAGTRVAERVQYGWASVKQARVHRRPGKMHVWLERHRARVAGVWWERMCERLARLRDLGRMLMWGKPTWAIYIIPH